MEAAKCTIKVSLLHVEGQHGMQTVALIVCLVKLSFLYTFYDSMWFFSSKYIFIYTVIYTNCITYYCILTYTVAARLPDVLRLKNCILATVQFACVAHGGTWLKSGTYLRRSCEDDKVNSLLVGLVVLFDNILCYMNLCKLRSCIA